MFQVRVINEPIKLGWVLDSLFIELHPPLEEDQEKYQNYELRVTNFINNFLSSPRNKRVENLNIDQEALKKAIVEKSGIPVLISNSVM